MSAVDFIAVCLGGLITAVSAALIGFTLASARAPYASGGVWCEATVVEEGTRREWLLGGHRARSPRRALRWIRAQAPRLADRIDPSPHARWASSGLLRPYDGAGPDAAALLRRWPSDGVAHRDALRALEDGGLYVLTVPDGDGLRYRISVRSLGGAGGRSMAGKPAYGRRGTEKLTTGTFRRAGAGGRAGARSAVPSKQKGES
ncbi:hypothetical protein F0L17_12400 [Streptomyces sp. TRM43335]|uniref:Uncharacterized protein n=1 Tax=Streptomyces taklimakanensis TaxID=2569853 RepID=A0A6G2BDC2_9ACTN|nr:hypothetical protein [Streptomyces taklimakanensis]MTE19902.1 hypothetical protein [Streptomyces taklimakanensis]